MQQVVFHIKLASNALAHTKLPAHPPKRAKFRLISPQLICHDILSDTAPNPLFAVWGGKTSSIRPFPAPVKREPTLREITSSTFDEEISEEMAELHT